MRGSNIVTVGTHEHSAVPDPSPGAGASPDHDRERIPGAEQVAVSAERGASPDGAGPVAGGWSSGVDGWAVAAGVPLLLAGALHIVCMFFSQAAGVGPMDASAATVVTEAVLAGGWLVAAGLALPASSRPAAGALAVGLALAELGLVVATVGSVGETPGPGLLLLASGWVLGAAGAVVACLGSPVRLGRPNWGAGPRWLTFAVGAAAVVVGIALLPAWDHYRVLARALGRVVVVNESDTFSLPAVVLGGTVAAAVAWAAVPIVAALWRPARLGAVAGAGVLVAVASQVASAVVGLDPSGVLDGLFGTARVRDLGLELLGASLRPWFDVETIAGLVLAVLLVARWWTPDPADGAPIEHAPWAPGVPPWPVGPPGAAWPHTAAVPPPGWTWGGRDRAPDGWPGSPGAPSGPTGGWGGGDGSYRGEWSRPQGEQASAVGFPDPPPPAPAPEPHPEGPDHEGADWSGWAPPTDGA